MTRWNRQLFVLGLLLLLIVVTFIPLYVSVMVSQKNNAEIFTRFWSPPSELRPEFYQDAYTYLWPYIWNSLQISAVAVSGVLFLSSLSGYAFARLNFTGKNTFYILLLSLMMVPGILTLIPAFNWIKQFPLAGGNDLFGRGGSGLLNSWWALWLPYLAGGQLFGIMLCRTFFETLPEDLFEAARMDGASEFYIYRSIAVPLSLPILATLAIMQFMGNYNDYIWPLVTISESSKQVFSVGVTRFGFEGNLNMGPVMAGYVIGSIPMLLVFAFGMRYYVQGLTSGALKA